MAFRGIDKHHRHQTEPHTTDRQGRAGRRSPRPAQQVGIEFELGSALAKIGVQTAIALDMNHTWPTGYYYDAARPGKRPVGHKILAETYYPPSKYYSQDKKDFIVAQLRP